MRFLILLLLTTTFIFCSKQESNDLISNHPVINKTIYEYISDKPEYSMFKSLVDSVGLVTFLNDTTSKLTVIIQPNEVFKKFSDRDMASLLHKENRDLLTEVVKHHIFEIKFYTNELYDKQLITSYYGLPVEVRIYSDYMTIGQPKIIAHDIELKNGIIHVTENLMVHLTL